MTKWTEEQTKAIYECGTNIIVSAGAGSGKTAVLTERTIQKLINGADINRLLILTFTNAAAFEMKQRIRKAIKKAGLKDQLDAISSAYITTFDSFALSVVKKYHLYLNIPKNISIMDGSVEEIKTNEIITKIFEDSYEDENFKKLVGDFCYKNDDSMKEIFKVFSSKIDLIINKQEYLDNYISLHFSDEFIDNTIKNYNELINNTLDKIKDNYEQLACRVDTKYLDAFNLYDLLNAKTYEAVKSSLLKIGTPRKNNNCEDDFKTYKDKISELIKRLNDLTRFENNEEIKTTILKTKDYVSALIKIKKEFDKNFMDYKRKVNLYTFNDIAHMAIDVVQNNSSIQKELKDSFDEIMIDEYQDTSDIQETFINLIANNNVYMVGDIKQSIYRFRNANPYIFQKKYDDFSKGIGGKKIDLLKNFRSRSEVLNNINIMFNLIMDHAIGDADYEKSHQMNYGNTAYEELWHTDDNHDMEIFTYNPKDVKKYSKDEVEAFTVASDILSKINNKYQIVDKDTGNLRDAEFRDFSIIMDRGTSFDLYKKIFEYMHIPLSQIKNEKLSASDDLVIFSNIVRLIVKINQKEYDAEFKYLFTSVSRSFIVNDSDENIFKILTSRDFFQTDLFKKCQSIKIDEISNYELINTIIDKFDVYEKLLTVSNIKETMIRLDYLKKLSKDLAEIGYTPLEYAEYLKEMSVSDKIEYELNAGNINTVKILNIHKSKGLEYSICYFTGLAKKINKDELKSKFLIDDTFTIITPYIQDGIKDTVYKDLLIDKENIKIISERIRLFYVALTRAKEHMIILLPMDEEKESYSSLVPESVRSNYVNISSMLLSILPILKPYIKEIDLNNINLTLEYDQKKSGKEIDNIPENDKKINVHNVVIEYEKQDENHFSKTVNKLISKEDYDNMHLGTKLHSYFELNDFKNSNNEYVKKFVKHIDLNYRNVYKEYEFYYEKESEILHGIIDLLLEYDDHMVIIDYKTKNVVDENYKKQLKGYQEYIYSITGLKAEIYLYSILDDKLYPIN